MLIKETILGIYKEVGGWWGEPKQANSLNTLMKCCCCQDLLSFVYLTCLASHRSELG